MLKLPSFLNPLASRLYESLNGPKVVEIADVRFDELSVMASPKGRNLHMSGLVFDSGLAVSDINSKQAEDAVIVEITLTLAKPGMSGSFHADIPLRSDTNRVLFGRELAPIWDNGAKTFEGRRTTASN
jgi:hypothetical protein